MQNARTVDVLTARDLTKEEAARRRDFPICARNIYMAHAADAPLPRVVAEAMHALVENASCNEKMFEESLVFIAETRQAVAQFLGANADEISLTGPTSAGLSAIANGLQWEAGDEIVCYFDEYPANVYPWLSLQRHGVKLIFLEPAQIGEITPELVERALTPRTKLVALASANYCSGYRIDVDAIGAICQRHHVLFCVDGIQTLGAFATSLKYVDFLSAGAQKWLLGPSGAGILYVKKDRRDLLWPTVIGGWNVQSPDFIAQSRIEFAPGGQKFEPGAYSFVLLAGMAAAVKLLNEVRVENVAAAILALTASLREQIGPSGFKFLSPTEEKHRSGILTLRHPGVSSEAVIESLAHNKVVISLRRDRAHRAWLRISPHFYNTEAEVGRVAELLNEAVR